MHSDKAVTLKKQRESKEDLDGQWQRRPEGEQYRLDQDWWSDQKQRAPEESCKSLILCTLIEERKEEDKTVTLPYMYIVFWLRNVHSYK